MPHCAWFGTRDDHAVLLRDIFAWGAIEVYELNSRINEPLRQFLCPEDVMAQFDRPYSGGALAMDCSLNLFVKGAGPGVQVIRNPHASSSGARGWHDSTDTIGCIDMALRLPQPDVGPGYSATNTVTETRIGAVDGVVTDPKGQGWDIRMINKASAALNRMIRKRSVARLNSVCVHPGALALWDAGAPVFRPWWPAEHAAMLVRG